MLLVVDIGNTQTVIGLYKDDELTLAKVGASNKHLASQVGWLIDPRSSRKQFGRALVTIIVFCATRGVGFGPDGRPLSTKAILKAYRSSQRQ